MKVIKTYLLLFLTTVLLFNCKKYPEGGCERRGPKNIIGDWKLSLYEVNGIDSTDLINYNGDDRYKKIKFYQEGKGKAAKLYARANGASVNSVNFSNKNTILSFQVTGTYFGSVGCGGNPTTCFKEIFSPEDGSDKDWDIIKLTKDELILASSQKNTYKIKLNK
jgi:hypothetical protein